MIDCLWTEAKKYTSRKLLYPFIFFLTLYWSYTNIITNMRENSQKQKNLTLTVQIMLLICSVYFLSNETQ